MDRPEINPALLPAVILPSHFVFSIGQFGSLLSYDIAVQIISIPTMGIQVPNIGIDIYNTGEFKPNFGFSYNDNKISMPPVLFGGTGGFYITSENDENLLP